MPSLVGTTISNAFLVQEKVNEDAIGTLYRGQTTATGEPVSILELHENAIPEGPGEFERNFAPVAQKLAAINNPHIPRLHYYGMAGEAAVIVTELMEGETVERMIKAQGQLDERTTIDIATQVAEGLEAARQQNLVHGDLRPSRILVSPQGIARISGYGITQGIKGGGFTQAVMKDAWSYISPEQVTGKPRDIRSDIYLLGVIMYEMLSGGPPFIGASSFGAAAAHILKPAPSILEKRPDLSSDLERIVHRCLEKDPDLRYQTPAEVLAALAGGTQAAATVAMPAAGTARPVPVQAPSPPRPAPAAPASSAPSPRATPATPARAPAAAAAPASRGSRQTGLIIGIVVAVVVVAVLLLVIGVVLFLVLNR